MKQATETVDHKARARCVHRVVPRSRSVRITLLADRGFGNEQLYGLLEALGWYDVMRFREYLLVGACGE